MVRKSSKTGHTTLTKAHKVALMNAHARLLKEKEHDGLFKNKSNATEMMTELIAYVHSPSSLPCASRCGRRMIACEE